MDFKIADGGVILTPPVYIGTDTGKAAVFPLRNTEEVANEFSKKISNLVKDKENVFITINVNCGVDYSGIAELIEKELRIKNIRVGGVGYV